MDPTTLTIIITIVFIIIVLDLYKRQNQRITSNLHEDNLKQLLTITALEHRFNKTEAGDEVLRQSLTNEITNLINSYERGELQADVFQVKMDNLLNKLN